MLLHGKACCRKAIISLPACRRVQAHAPLLLHLSLERPQRVATRLQRSCAVVAAATCSSCCRGGGGSLLQPSLAPLQVFRRKLLTLLLLLGALDLRHIKHCHHELRLGHCPQEAKPISKAASCTLAREAVAAAEVIVRPRQHVGGVHQQHVGR